MKKILGLSVAALLVIAMVGGGTWAFFQDTESSTGNALQAGTLDLTLGEPAGETINIEDGYPGASGNAGYFTLTNIGSLAGDLSFVLNNVIDTESNGVTEFEHDTTTDTGLAGPYTATGGSETTLQDTVVDLSSFLGSFVTVPGKGWREITTATENEIQFATFGTTVAEDDVYYISTTKVGELSEFATIRLWISDNNEATTLNGTTDKVLTLTPDGPTFTAGVSTASGTFGDHYYSVASFAGIEFDATTLGLTMQEDGESGDTLYVFVDWIIVDPGTENNTYQGDSVEFDLEFTLKQAD